MDDDYERILCVKNEVYVYRIPPRGSARGHRAADWKLDQPDWTGRLRIVTKAGLCSIKFEDKFSGDLFADAPIQDYPGVNVESVLDSSRYFVVKIQNSNGQHAFIGMGFQDRGDSFDFNVTLQDHFKREKQSEVLETVDSNTPKLDLGFKEGQTIKINLNSNSSRPANPDAKTARLKGGANPIGVLPPPPGGKVPLLAPPPSGSAPGQVAPQQQQQQETQSGPVEWGDFSSNSSKDNGTSWVTF